MGFQCVKKLHHGGPDQAAAFDELGGRKCDKLNTFKLFLYFHSKSNKNQLHKKEKKLENENSVLRDEVERLRVQIEEQQSEIENLSSNMDLAKKYIKINESIKKGRKSNTEYEHYLNDADILDLIL